MNHLVHYKVLFESLLPRLKCPRCTSERGLSIEEGSLDCSAVGDHAQIHLVCPDCAEVYPITADFIPVLWSRELEAAFREKDSSTNGECSAIAANLRVYDLISEDYDHHRRRGGDHAARIRTAFERVCSSSQELGLLTKNRTHLDFGCGPGHVLGWLKSPRIYQIGMDVSLVNLRVARSNTGCAVVCGDAAAMPLKSGVVDIVTEASVLHHIADWKLVVRESMRVCCLPGGIILDAEPSQRQMEWSALATFVFNLRFTIYRFLSGFWREKHVFADTGTAKLNLIAETHHQPGGGFPLEEVADVFREGGFDVDIFQAAGPDLKPRPKPSWQKILLDFLSFKNPWNPANYGFTAVAVNSAGASAASKTRLYKQ